MRKVRLLYWFDGQAPGTSAEYADDFAQKLVAAGTAEYAGDPKEKPYPEGRGKRDKMLRPKLRKG